MFRDFRSKSIFDRSQIPTNTFNDLLTHLRSSYFFSFGLVLFYIIVGEGVKILLVKMTGFSLKKVYFKASKKTCFFLNYNY